MALGLVEDEPIDPAKLTESLTTAQAEAKNARVELAIFRAAAAAGGDPAALLDSQSDYGRNLWALLSLELWHRQFVDGAGA